MISDESHNDMAQPDDWLADFTDTRTQAERELDYLRDYLARPRWTAEQAIWLLSGFVPAGDEGGTMGGPGDWGFRWLPCHLDWRNMDAFTLERHVEMELQEVRSFVTGTTRSPRRWIEAALGADYEPEWLGAASEDEVCRPFLPERVLLHTLTGHPAETATDTESHSAWAINAAEQRWHDNKQWQLIEQVGRPIFDATISAHPLKRNWGQGALINRIIEAMQDHDGKYYEHARSAVRRHIQHWLDDLPRAG
jgi:hypothetical protein